MNFDNEAPVDTVIGQLLAFIILFQKKLEYIKCKLAGNEQFHTRIAFQTLDMLKRNQITLDSLLSYFRNTSQDETQSTCQLFLRRYSKNGALTYDEFLKLTTPKSNKTLAQRMLIRTYPKGATLDQYLQKYLQELLSLYLKMTSVTERLRSIIQKNESLTQLDLIEFFHQRISTPDNMFYFLQRCASKGEVYDISPLDSIYLTYHITSGNDIEDLTEVDIKQILCPLDMNNFQKYVTKPTFLKQNTFYQDNKTSNQYRPQHKTQSANFLGKTYQKKMTQPVLRPQQIKQNKGESILPMDRFININAYQKPPTVERNSAVGSSYGNMYIDNFAQSELNDRLQINDYIGNNMPNRPQYEVFQDDLNSNNSNISASRGSAFDRS